MLSCITWQAVHLSMPSCISWQQCSYPCFPIVLLTTAPQNILSFIIFMNKLDKYYPSKTINLLDLPHNASFCSTEDIQLWKNIGRKGEITCKKQFLLSSQCFLPYIALTFHFDCFLECHLQFD